MVMVIFCVNILLMALQIITSISERYSMKKAWKKLYMLECVIDSELNSLKVNKNTLRT